MECSATRLESPIAMNDSAATANWPPSATRFALPRRVNSPESSDGQAHQRHGKRIGEAGQDALVQFGGTLLVIWLAKGSR